MCRPQERLQHFESTATFVYIFSVQAVQIDSHNGCKCIKMVINGIKRAV